MISETYWSSFSLLSPWLELDWCHPRLERPVYDAIVVLGWGKSGQRTRPVFVLSSPIIFLLTRQLIKIEMES